MNRKRAVSIFLAHLPIQILVSGMLVQSEKAKQVHLFVCTGQFIYDTTKSIAKIEETHFIHKKNLMAYIKSIIKKKGSDDFILQPPSLSKKKGYSFFIAFCVSWERGLYYPNKITKMTFCAINKIQGKQKTILVPPIQKDYTFDPSIQATIAISKEITCIISYEGINTIVAAMKKKSVWEPTTTIMLSSQAKDRNLTSDSSSAIDRTFSTSHIIKPDGIDPSEVIDIRLNNDQTFSSRLQNTFLLFTTAGIGFIGLYVLFQRAVQPIEKDEEGMQ